MGHSGIALKPEYTHFNHGKGSPAAMSKPKCRFRVASIYKAHTHSMDVRRGRERGREGEGGGLTRCLRASSTAVSARQYAPAKSSWICEAQGGQTARTSGVGLHETPDSAKKTKREEINAGNDNDNNNTSGLHKGTLLCVRHRHARNRRTLTTLSSSWVPSQRSQYAAASGLLAIAMDGEGRK